MTKESRDLALVTELGTDYKTFRTFMTGSATGAFSLATTAQDIKAAIAELKAAITAAAGGMPTDATTTARGVGQIATTAEVTAGTDDFSWVTASKLAAKLTAWAQPLDSDLTSIAALTTTSYGRAFLALADQAALLGLLPASSETVASKIEIATQTETNTGTDDARAVTPLKFQTRLAAYAQPLSSNLTALDVSSTSYGRAFLALVNQAGLMALVAAASETASGIIEIATQTETNTGTDDVRAVTPLKFQTRLAAYAMPLSYLDTDVALAANSDTKVASQKAVKAYADGLIAANDAMVFKGVIDASANPNYPASNRGDTYRISVAGKIGGASGTNVEAGDMLTALTDGTASGTQASVGAQWNIVQANIDGAVVGPASATSTDFATFSGTSGKVIQDSGLSLDTSTSLGTSDAKIPSQKAVKSYADATFATLAATGNLDADLVAAYTTAKS